MTEIELIGGPLDGLACHNDAPLPLASDYIVRSFDFGLLKYRIRTAPDNQQRQRAAFVEDVNHVYGIK